MKGKFSVLLVCLFLISQLAFAGGGQQTGPVTPAVSTVPRGTNPMPIVNNNVTLTLASAENYMIEASLTNNLPIWKKFESITGVKIDWQIIQGANYNDVINVRIAAGRDLPDIFQLGSGPAGDPTRLAADGLILQLDDLIAAHAPNLQKFFIDFPVYKALMTSPDGKQYIIQSVNESNGINAWTTLIRKDWLDKLNMPIPVTINDFYNMLAAFKTRDPDGVGTQNLVPYAGYQSFTSSYNICGNGFGLHLDQSGGFWPDENGRVQFEYLSPAFREYLVYMNKLYSEQLIDQQLFHPTLPALESLIILNYVGGSAGGSNPIQRWDTLQKGAGHATVDWISVPPPVKDMSVKNFVEKRAFMTRSFAITRDCKIVETAVRWIDYVYASPEGILLANYGIEGESFTIVNGKPKFTDFILNNPNGLAPLPSLRTFGANTDILGYCHNEAFLDLQISEKQVNHITKFQPMFIERFPSVIATSDESRAVSSTMPEIRTYVEEMVIRFITGREPISNFDRFTNTIRGMGIENVLRVHQAQYDRYAKIIGQ